MNFLKNCLNPSKKKCLKWIIIIYSKKKWRTNL